jgi:hypothetical protein
MAFKIALQDIEQITSTDGTSMVLATYAGRAVLIPESWFYYTEGSPVIRLSCADDGNVYRLNARMVDGQPTLSLSQTVGEATSVSLLCPDDSNTYNLVVRIVDGEPTLQLTLA